ncbi:MAG: FG-GAP-like repeat-containing protein [Bacteroidota bacterium]
MKTLVIIVILLAACLAVNAQQFSNINAKALDENMTSIQARWVSVDADTLLDFIVVGVVNDQVKIVVYDNQLVKKNTILTGMKTGNLQVADWDRDNKIDILIAGKTAINTDALFVFKNNGDFTLTKQSDKLIEHSGQFRVADMNNDAIPDLVTFGTSFIRIYKNDGTTLTKSFERSDITPTDMSIFDMTNDGLNDIVITSTTLTTFVNHGDSKFERRDGATPLNGMLSLADMNSDGYFDVIVASQNNIRTWNNNGDTLIVSATINRGTKSSLFTGDVNSNGTVDVLVDSIGLLAQVFGDHNRDGKPDVIHVKDSIGSQWLKLYRNATPIPNARPQAPAVGFAVSTFDRTFIFWDPATDDHTSPNSITYDVWLGTGPSNVITPSYSLTNARRMTVSHGNAGTNVSLIIKGLTDNRYFYGVQSVDNAYNGSLSTGGGGVCPCFDLSHTDVQACKGTEVKLGAGQTATWLSLSRGFLEKTDTLKFTATATDTLFAFVPQGLDCSKNRVFVVHVYDGPLSGQGISYACKDQAVQMGIDPGWLNPTWSTTPPQVNVSSIIYYGTWPDTVHVTAKGWGCDYNFDYFIMLSQPVVSVDIDAYQVMKGNSVQLQAKGKNVETWQWDPPDGLDNITIPNPIATPLFTTEYTVFGIDSMRCIASAKVLVLVQETAFVPNLFTPNGDGKNDNLVIYGLTSTSSFNFRIYNREGSTVYETKDMLNATTTGWNGTVQGIRQPSGLYYWKIDGALPDGSKLLLNGKSTGSILLVQ